MNYKYGRIRKYRVLVLLFGNSTNIRFRICYLRILVYLVFFKKN